MQYLNQHWRQSLAAIAACALITPWVSAQEKSDAPQPRQQTKELPESAQRKDEADRPRRKSLPTPPEASTGTYRVKGETDSPQTTDQRAELRREGQEADRPDAARLDRRQARKRVLTAQAQQLIRDGRYDEATEVLRTLRELGAEGERGERFARDRDRLETREAVERQDGERDEARRDRNAGSILEVRPRLRPAPDRPRGDSAEGLANRVDRLQEEMRVVREELRNISVLLARLAGDRAVDTGGRVRSEESRESDRQPESRERERDRDREAPPRGAGAR